MAYFRTKLKKICSCALCAALAFLMIGNVPVQGKAEPFTDTVADFSGIYITRKKISVKKDGTYALDVREIQSGAGEITWKSANPKVATVSEAGVVTAVGSGETTVTATKGAYQDTCSVVVTEQDPMIAEYAHLMELKRDFLDLRFGMFLHFNSATYEFRTSGGDWGGEGYVSTFQPKSWNPSQLDCIQWAKAAKSAGMTFAVLTTKHHDGFDIWNSAYTAYDVGSGKDTRDVVSEFVTACRKEGIQPGLYFSMLDLKHNITSSHCTPSDVEFIKAQLKELLTNYGEIPFLIFDGWNADWGGPSYKDLPYEEIVDFVRALQPDCLVINISCEINDTHSDITMFENAAGQEVPDWFSNVSLACHTLTPCWFWMDSYPGISLRTADWAINQKYVDLKETDTVFILNVSPNPKGKLIDKYMERLAEIGKASQKTADIQEIPQSWYADYDYTQNLLFRKTVAQSSTDGRAAAVRAVDGYTDYEFDHGTAARTQVQSNAWWQGDIGYSTALQEVIIFAGEGANTLRNAGWVFVSETPMSEKATWEELHNDSSVKGFSLAEAQRTEDCFTVSLSGSYGRYIRIALKDRGALTLSEVLATPVSGKDVPETVTNIRTTILSKTVRQGTAFSELRLPETVQMVTGHGRLLTGTLQWDMTAYQPDVPGVYTVYGSVKEQDTQVRAKAVITVKKTQIYQEVESKSITASSWWGQPNPQGDARPIHVINHSGLTLDEDNILLSTHDNPYNASTMWHSEDGFQTGTLVFDFGSVKKVDNVLIWNHNQLNCSDRGIKTAEFYYTTEANPKEQDWISIGVYTLQKADESDHLLPTDLLYLGGISARKIKLVATENYGGSNVGLSEVLFLENTASYASEEAGDALATEIAQFEYCSWFQYSENAYQAAKEVYTKAKKALETQSSKAEIQALTTELENSIKQLRTTYIDKQITNLSAMYFEVEAGAAAMPDTVLVTFNDGTAEQMPVTWYQNITSRFTQPDTFSVQGRLTGTPYSFCASVVVRGVSKKALESYIATYEALELKDYSASSVKTFSEALAAAKEMVKREDASQQEIDMAKDTLKQAKYRLERQNAENGSLTPAGEQQAGDAYGTAIRILLIVLAVVVICCGGLLFGKKFMMK